MNSERRALHQRSTPLIQDYLAGAATHHTDKVGLIQEREARSWGEVAHASDELAAFLEERGVCRGDRVIIFADNSIEAVVAFWAVLKANAVASIIHPQTKAAKLAYLLNDSEAVALFTDSRLSKAANAAVAQSQHVKLTICWGALSEETLACWRDLLPFEQARIEGAAAPWRTCIDGDLATIIYTSGTTGEPKGVMLSHRNMRAAADSVTACLEMIESDVLLGALPLSFSYGLYQPIMAAALGATVVLERSFAYPAKVIQSIQSHRVTGIPGVPTMFAMMAEMESIRALDWSHVRFLTSAAAAMPRYLIDSVRELMPLAKLYVMYGQTECKRATYLPPEDLDRKPGSVGVAIPNTEVWTVDADGNRTEPNQPGQLVIRGPTVMQGYWRKPDATSEKLRPGPILGERVLYTGDLCRIDDEGYVYFVARMDDVINTRGEKVAPLEVEQALMEIPGIKEVAVIGVPDELLGQALKAFVVVRDSATLSERTIISECRRRLEGHMVPKTVVFVTGLPKTANGKSTKLGLS